MTTKYILCAILCLSLLLNFRPDAGAEERTDSSLTEQYRKSLAVNPSDSEANFLLGTSLIRDKSYKEAIHYLIKAYPAMEDDEDMNFNLGLAYYGAGDLEKAQQHYTLVNKYAPEAALSKYKLDVAYYNLGVSYQKKDDLERALDMYRTSIKINEKQSSAHCQTGEIHFIRKELDKALESLNICKEREPERNGINSYLSAIYQRRSNEYAQKDNFKKARQELEKAESYDPENESVIYNLGFLAYREGDFKNALLLLEKAKGVKSDELRKGVLNMFQNIGSAYQKKEDWHGAISAYKQAISMDRENADMHFFIGYCHLKAREYDLARLSFSEALRIDPGHQRASINLNLLSDLQLRSHIDAGENFIEKGIYESAFTEFMIALSIDPFNEKALAGKAKTEKIVTAQRKAAEERKEREFNGHVIEGIRLIKEEKFPDAVKRFEMALKLKPENLEAKDGLRKSRSLLVNAVGRHMASADKAFAEQRYYDAARGYEAGLGIDPENPELIEKLENSRVKLFENTLALLNEARRNEASGKYQEALALYKNILAKDPENRDARDGKSRMSAIFERKFDDTISKAKGLAEEGELLRAAENFKKAIDLRPDNHEAIAGYKAVQDKIRGLFGKRLAEAEAFRKSGRYSDAINSYRAALVLDGNSSAANAGLKSVMKSRNDALEKYISSGAMSYKDGNYPEAMKHFSNALKIDGNNAEASKLLKDTRTRMDALISPWYNSGVEAYNRGDMKTAVISFKKVVNIDPSHKEANEYIKQMGSEKIRAALRGEIDKFYISGVEFYTDGNYPEAIDTWKKVLELDPQHEKALLNIEKARRKMEGVKEIK